MEKHKKHTRSEWSWIMYDWANSVYATIIMAAVYPTFFAAVAPSGDMWWGYGTSIATFVVAVLAPFLGAIADYNGMKKKFFGAFLTIGVIFTAAMAFADDWRLMLVGYILSYIGFSGSCLFYDSFLTDVTTPERMDMVSAKGYAMGYIGGSTIPFIVSIVIVLLMNSSPLSVKISVVITSVWWLVFSIPFLRDVKQVHSLGEKPPHLMSQTLKNIGGTLKGIFKNKAILLFMLAYFFYIDGVGTVIHMSTAYGATLGLNTVGMILALLVTQLVAAPCSVLFARFSKKLGSIRMLGIAVGVYFLICTVGFYMGFSLEPSQFAAEDAYNAAFDSVTLSDEGERAALEALRESGLGVLNSAERSEEFEALVEASSLGESLKAQVRSAVAPCLAVITDTGEYDLALIRSNILFWCMAVLVGTCQGGIQALSRSYFGKLIPPAKSTEYFGFFDIFGKFAAVMGPALYGFIKTLTGRSSYGILSLMLLFIIGGILLYAGRNRFREAEAQNSSAEG